MKPDPKKSAPVAVVAAVDSVVAAVEAAVDSAVVVAAEVVADTAVVVAAATKAAAIAIDVDQPPLAASRMKRRGPADLETSDRRSRVFCFAKPQAAVLHTRKIAPIRLPSIEFADKIVSVSSTMAHTPRALAM